jgi:hypothetical protein
MTRQIVEVAEPLAVVLHDHIIFGRDGIPQIGRGRDRRDAGAALAYPNDCGLKLVAGPSGRLSGGDREQERLPALLSRCREVSRD